MGRCAAGEVMLMHANRPLTSPEVHFPPFSDVPAYKFTT